MTHLTRSDSTRSDGLAGFRAARDELFRSHPSSPLPAADRPGFTGLRWFPPDPAAVVEAPLRPASGTETIDTGGPDGVVRYRRVAVAETPWGPLTLWWIEAYGGGLFLPLREANVGASIVAHAPQGDDGYFLMLLTPPPASQVEALPRDLTLVVDVSGSMAGAKMEQARAALLQALATLGARDRFRIIAFSSEVREYREGFATATAAELEGARRFVEGLQSGGGTNLEGAVRQALAPMLGSPAIATPPRSTCPDVLTLLSRHLEGDLHPRVCATMEAHLAQCPHCRGACDSLKRTLAACRQLPTPDVPVALAATVKAAIQSFLDASQETSVTDRKR